MKVFVNGEERHLHLVDRFTDCDYAKVVVCGQDLLQADEYGYFYFTEEEFSNWQTVLNKLQASEDIRFALKDSVDEQELKDYIYEETKYLTNAMEIADMEYMSYKELQEAVTAKDTKWLEENNFMKTLKKI
jgi:predicted RNA-binding protein